LAHARAAEVFRAVSEGQRATAELLQTAARSLADVVDDTATTGSATVVGVLGLLALVARNSSSLPGWLVVIAALAAVAGIAAVVQSRWSRIDEQEQAAVRVSRRLANDPLLPPREKAEAHTTIEAFGLASKAKAARWRIMALGAASCVVALGGAGWLVWSTSPNHPTTPTVTTTTTMVSSMGSPEGSGRPTAP
jgi:hypothetical protein